MSAFPFPAGTYLEGTTHGNWYVKYGGYGTASSDGTTLCFQPAAPLGGDTHAVWVETTSTFNTASAPLVIQATVTTTAQLRSGGANTWEVGWLAWGVGDRAYYFVLKTNGWELGKLTVGGLAQDFYGTGDYPRNSIGTTYQLRVEQVGGTIKCYVNGSLVTTYTDFAPLPPGKVAVYCEDARTCWSNVDISNTLIVATPAFSGAATVSTTAPNTTNPYTYKFVVANSGTGIGSARAVFTAPTGVTFGAYSSTSTGSGSAVAPSGSGAIDTVVTLPPGATMTFTVSAIITGGPGTYTPSASFNGVGVTVPAVSIVDTTPSFDVSQTLEALTPSVELGAVAQYKWRISNAGPDRAAGVQIYSALPSGVTARSWTTSGVQFSGIVANGTGTINTTLTIQSGGYVDILLSDTVSKTAEIAVATTTTVAPPVGDGHPNNNVPLTVTIPIRYLAKFAATLSSHPNTVEAGGSTELVLTIQNSGAGSGSILVKSFKPYDVTSWQWRPATITGAVSGYLPVSTNSTADFSQRLTFAPGSTIVIPITAHLSLTPSSTLVQNDWEIEGLPTQSITIAVTVPLETSLVEVQPGKLWDYVNPKSCGTRPISFCITKGLSLRGVSIGVDVPVAVYLNGILQEEYHLKGKVVSPKVITKNFTLRRCFTVVAGPEDRVSVRTGTNLLGTSGGKATLGPTTITLT